VLASRDILLPLLLCCTASQYHLMLRLLPLLPLLQSRLPGGSAGFPYGGWQLHLLASSIQNLQRSASREVVSLTTAAVAAGRQCGYSQKSCEQMYTGTWRQQWRMLGCLVWFELQCWVCCVSVCETSVTSKLGLVQLVTTVPVLACLPATTMVL
jgi:hypothetical protein